jgi:hypothetical protein
MPADFERTSFVEELKSLGAVEVRKRLSEGFWAWPADESAEEWLRHEDTRLSSESEERAEARMESQILIASEAARWARWAAIIATVAAIIAMKNQIIEFILS